MNLLKVATGFLQLILIVRAAHDAETKHRYLRDVSVVRETCWRACRDRKRGLTSNP